MEYGALDSSGTDDDNPHPVYNRVPVGGRVAGNGRSFAGSAPYQRMQSDMEPEIHSLEQIAYGAVLRAFKAQSDALSWEKEGLITELRKELRVSDDEHRELLAEVNADDLIRRIREWREAGGIRKMASNASQLVNNQLLSSTVSGSRKRQKISLSGHSFATTSQALHPQSVAGTTQPLSSVVKWGPNSGTSGRRPNAGQPAFAPAKPMQYQFTDHISSGDPTGDPSQSMRDPLIGRRVMIRWPADNNFYEAVITEYNPVDGRHSLVYDSNTPNATLEWVNIKEFPPEDIRWVGDVPVISQLGEAGAPTPATGRAFPANQFNKEIQPSGRDAILEDAEEIEIFHTETLIKKVEKVLDASHPDEFEIDKAKKLLKEQEQTLIEAIAKLTSACDRDDDFQLSHGHLPTHQPSVDHHGRTRELEAAGRISNYELARG